MKEIGQGGDLMAQQPWEHKVMAYDDQRTMQKAAMRTAARMSPKPLTLFPFCSSWKYILQIADILKKDVVAEEILVRLKT